MTRGDVVRVELPRPQGQPGREQFGTRPAIVLQRSANLSTVIVVPFTSNLKATGLDGSVVVEPSRKNGLLVRSIALCCQVRAIDKRRIRETLGRLSVADLESVDGALRSLLGL